MAAETGRMTEKESRVANLPADSPSGQFVPFGASSDSLKRLDSIDNTVLSGKTTTAPKYPMYEDYGQDWKVSNAFDRNSYYGPTDFGHMPDELECSIPAKWCSESTQSVTASLLSSSGRVRFSQGVFTNRRNCIWRIKFAKIESHCLKQHHHRRNTRWLKAAASSQGWLRRLPVIA